MIVECPTCHYQKSETVPCRCGHLLALKDKAMTDEQFKRACERAGMVRDSWTGRSFTLFGWRHGDWMLQYDHPALKPYVASLLVAQVRERDSGPGLTSSTQRALHLAYCRQFKGLPPGYMLATDEQRILAAMEVLDG